MKKITVNEARELFAKAKNNGERVEALTILELYCTQYNPYLAGDKGGDVYAPSLGNVQVKYYDGCIRVPNGTTGNKVNDLRTALENDASDTWMIWFNLKEYVLLNKWELFDTIANKLNTEELIRYNTRSGETTLRLECGPAKRKYFYGKVRQRVRAI